MTPHDRHGASNRRQLDWFYNSLFMLTTTTTLNFRPFATRIRRWLVVLSHKGTVMGKAFPWHNVVMNNDKQVWNEWSDSRAVLMRVNKSSDNPQAAYIMILVWKDDLDECRVINALWHVGLLDVFLVGEKVLIAPCPFRALVVLYRMLATFTKYERIDAWASY